MPVYVNFIFPEGCSEFYQEAQMSSVPRVGEYIQGSRPESGRYRVVEVRYAIAHQDDASTVDDWVGPVCDEATVVLEVTDAINYDPGKQAPPSH